jgi:glycosyltransferase involved in cell wall biosynthesis
MAWQTDNEDRPIASRPGGDRPLRLSIITPSLNANSFIAEAVESLLAQQCTDLEHIVVDGGSTDGTLETLRRYEHLRVLMRPALGLYPALNLGISEARGDTIGFLNADDRYLPGAIADAVSRLSAAPAIECASGGARIVRIESTGVRTVVAEYNDDAHKMLAWAPLLDGAPVINARFFRKSLIERLGGFDTRYRIAADREWLIRAKLAGMRIATLEADVYEYREHAGSLTINRTRSNAARIAEEHLDIANHYLRDGRAPAVMRRWHAWEAGRKIARHLARGGLWPAYRAVRQASATDMLWPAQLLAQLPRRVVSRLAT